MSGAEEYDLEEFLEIRAWVSIGFELLGYSWKHPRVVAFMERCGAEDRYRLPFGAYKRLAEALRQEMGDGNGDTTKPGGTAGSGPVVD